ncbi:MAG TPA: hypothetical protein VGF13_07830 [Verrucomicrobiae bacterium]
MKQTARFIILLRVLFLTGALLGASKASAFDLFPPDPSGFCVDTNGGRIPVRVTVDCEENEEPIVSPATKIAFFDNVWHGYLLKNTPGIFGLYAWSECEGKGDAATITIAEVDTITVSAGTEIDDEDDNADTKTFEVQCGQAEDGQVVIWATSNPVLSESALPSCWTATGGGGGAARSYRTVNALTPGTTTVSFTAGTSFKSVTIIVLYPCE